MATPSNLHLTQIAEFGTKGKRGNLLGIEPYMLASDYASAEAFHARLSGYLNIAGQRGWLSEQTIVVWPEYIGTWLVVAGEGEKVWGAPAIRAAIQAMLLSHPLRFARAYLASREKDRVVASIFRLKAPAMAGAYHAVFARLAREYRVTMVAGSIVLPSPGVENGVVVAGKGPLYNSAAVYRPDGLAQARLVRKAFPIRAEQSFTAAAPVAELPVFDTPAGRLGVLICADSWYPEPYACLAAQGVELIAVPSDGVTPQKWAGPWAGYDGWPAPADVDTRDVGVLSEAQAWRKYALAGRMASAGACCGINVFLRGELWDLDAHAGCATLVEGSTVYEAQGGGGAVLNLWLS